MHLELLLWQVAQQQEMYPCVCAGEERRVDEENPRSLIRGRLHEIQRALLPEGTQPVGIAPSLYELSKQAKDFSRLIKSAEERGDVLSFAAGLAGEKAN